MRRSEPTNERLGRLPSLAFGRLVAIVEAIAFWGSVLLPLGYLVALVLDGPMVVIVALIGANVVCLPAGHRHQPRIDAGVLAAMTPTVAREGER